MFDSQGNVWVGNNFIVGAQNQSILWNGNLSKFAPNGNVTGVQLAKMLLVSLGYKSENEGFTGNAWAPT